MTFDPFGDFEARGYLRNLEGEKDPAVIKVLEHVSFSTSIIEASGFLQSRDRIAYDDVREVHRILFKGFYPWAGQDRLETAPSLAISRGPVLFARPSDIRRSVDYGLELAQERRAMAAHPGEVMGYLAYGHPFLDGNGRALMLVHTHLAERAGIAIDWTKTNKHDYLVALTRELEAPEQGHLDQYLRPYVGPSIGVENLTEHVRRTAGLDGAREAPSDEIVGNVDDQRVQDLYQEYEAGREQSRDRDRGGRGR